MKRIAVALLVVVFLSSTCYEAKAPLNPVVCLALKYVAIPMIAATGYIICKCQADYYLVCYTDSSTGVRYWAASQANPRTLAKTGGVRWEGPWTSREEPDFRAWVNNQMDSAPMFPMGPLGTIPQPSYTNTLFLQASYAAGTNGVAKKWADLPDAAGNSVSVQAIEGENWSVGILPATGTNGMSAAQLQDYADCDVVITNPSPSAADAAFRAYFKP